MPAGRDQEIRNCCGMGVKINAGKIDAMGNVILMKEV